MPVKVSSPNTIRTSTSPNTTRTSTSTTRTSTSPKPTRTSRSTSPKYRPTKLRKFKKHRVAVVERDIVFNRVPTLTATTISNLSTDKKKLILSRYLLSLVKGKVEEPTSNIISNRGNVSSIVNMLRVK